METEKEIWRPVKGYEGKYEVSNMGRVRSLTFNKSNKSRILKCGTSSTHSYYKVSLCKDGVPCVFRVHRLVAEAFVPNPENKPVVNHINENTHDNRASNLNWMTIAENLNWGGARTRQALAHKGTPAWNKGKPAWWMKGKNFSEETKIKMSIKRKHYLRSQRRLREIVDLIWYFNTITEGGITEGTI